MRHPATASRISFRRTSFTFASGSPGLYLPIAVPILLNSLERVDLPSSDRFFHDDSVHFHAMTAPVDLIFEEYEIAHNSERIRRCQQCVFYRIRLSVTHNEVVDAGINPVVR